MLFLIIQVAVIFGEENGSSNWISYFNSEDKFPIIVNSPVTLQFVDSIEVILKLGTISIVELPVE